ncbi:unnamed protein product [Peronospora farinosa]|uniref:Alcohol dehydrogenase N-terminal domain-containing protein n=1 Tax=Peronospora farinosa TaxID=134698 RepID=A0AAV0UPZ6_9STRA|nr:unnamed protein product [Peronospora farinosa]CAI5738982.1 unnamed protein product [Peronospora farinosa]
MSKKRKLATVDTLDPKCLHDDTVDRDKEEAAWTVRTPSKQMSIANLISSPPTPTTSDDSFWAAGSALANVTIKHEKIEVDVATTETERYRSVSVPASASASSSNIPAAFLATQAFASPRDFFVAPVVVATKSDGNTEARTGATSASEKAHVICTLCQVIMGNRVYSLKRHLFRHHPQVFRVDSPARSKMTESRKNRGMKSDPDIANLRHNGNDQLVVQLKDTFGSADGPMKRCKMTDTVDTSSTSLQKHNDAFVDWLRSDVIPMKALQNQLFREFLTLVNPTFIMPQVIIQPQKLHKLNLLRSNHGKGDNSPISRCVDSSAIGSGTTELLFMKGLCLQGNGLAPQLITDLVVPTPAPHEALIEVLRAGICGTDLQMIDNYKPGFKGTLGHEFVGIVRKLGAQYTNDEQTQRMWIGKRVVGEINIPCNSSKCVTCARCNITFNRRGDTLTRDEVMRRNHCPNRSCLGIVRKDGAFSQFITLPLANLYEVPDSIVDSHAVFAEPLAAACRILEQQVVQSSDHVVVLGDGKLGLMVAEVLQATGAAKSVTLVGKHRDRLALAKHDVSSVYTLSSGDDAEMNALVARIASDREPFDVCVECTGSPSGITLALKLVRERGTVIIKSTCSVKRSTVDVTVVQSKRLRIVGSRCGPIPWALRLLRDRKIDVQKYIHGVYPLERAEAALAHAAQRGTLKIQLVMR